MFEQTFVDGVGKTNKTWTVFVSFVVQTAGIVVAIIIPLLFTDALPKTQLTSFLVAPPSRSAERCPRTQRRCSSSQRGSSAHTAAAVAPYVCDS